MFPPFCLSRGLANTCCAVAGMQVGNTPVSLFVRLEEVLGAGARGGAAAAAEQGEEEAGGEAAGEAREEEEEEEEDLPKLSAAESQKRCNAAGLSQAGRKSVLIERVQEAARESSSPEESGEGEGGADTRVDYLEERHGYAPSLGVRAPFRNVVRRS